ncbi:NAD(P)/FAD-dependent oxidoreductase [Microbacterium sp.]|uniref:FAD-dependent oxidoreductase n=1 Tax=Microbacterium sp. TaxID=51671 RepID=UPI002811C52B|nr:NAD(P)/FAD-dependent oxidoreductase [Microbacterium sp.]
MTDHDVIIAGAGPVGMLLGCLLAASGADVLVCERRDADDDRTRAIGVHPPGLAALDEAGIGDAVRAEALRLQGGEVLAGGRVLAAVRFGDDRPVLTLAQPRTHALLRERLARLGRPVVAGSRVLAARQDGDQVRVRVADADGRRELTGSFLVAADGVRSTLRRMLGVGWRARGRSARYAMVDITDPAPDAIARLHCEPAGLVESFPLPGGRSRWVVRELVEPLDGEWFAEAVLHRTGMRIEIPDGIRPAEFVAAQHRVQRTVHGRIVLLGDAAHEISPIGGQGMNLGWADARRLAPALLAALHGGASDLSGYDRRTARSTVDAQRRAAFFMAMGAAATPLEQRGREAVIRMLGSERLRERAARLVTMNGL